MTFSGGHFHPGDLKMALAQLLQVTFFAGLVTALGSGMTVKFFPLFFKNDCGKTPSRTPARDVARTHGYSSRTQE